MFRLQFIVRALVLSGLVGAVGCQGSPVEPAGQEHQPSQVSAPDRPGQEAPEVLAEMCGGFEPFCFTDVAEQSEAFLGYHTSIQLTPAQEDIKNEALTEIPAPCCSDQTAATCCCQCNLGRTIWGLSNHLIADLGYDAPQVQTTVEQWIAFINARGFSGDACYRGGCGRSFEDNGCGGMVAGEIIL